VPALCEELLFRAGFQKIFYRIWNNTAIALLASGIIFSLMHFSYYNFLSRLFLSIVLGWLYQYGKSLWFSITAHFLNNAAAVTLMYIAAVQHRDLQQYDQDPATWISALLLLPLAGMLYLYSKQNKQL
jgi:membrane protease YdiL (CAAX protease family)